ncbi:alpha/beta hydrolase [uncultured Photobacterium sp.]|uniref:alpha/beta hydrolase n=1 Tax=uncultured Photobacterium sp. TaxID=173973 RepID=UPI0026019821|nr:alpha/beta hydrolase [uncultured Photobacterium sp.]
MYKLMSGLIACVFLAGCNGGDSSNNQFAANRAEIIAKSCPPNMSCGFMAAPKDYEEPNGEMVDIFYGVHKAQDSANRIGALIFNFGGPSAAAVNGAAGMAANNLPPEILNHFDIVGIDPRGAGQSAFAKELTECAVAEYEGRGNCDATYQQVAPYLGSNSVVKDIDRLREHLGDEKLTFLGYSYGTRLGSLYAHTFPDRVRAIVLDAPMSPIAANNIEIRTGNAAGYEKIAKYRLGHNETRNNRYQNIVDQLFTAPEYNYQASDGVLTLKEGARAMNLTVARESSGDWSYVESGVTNLLDYDRVNSLKWLLSVLSNGYSYNSYSNYEDMLRGNALFKAVVCTDERTPLSDADIEASLDRFVNASSLYGTLAYHQNADLCKGWTAQRDPIAPVVDMDVSLRGKQILIIGGQYDPATPYAWAEEMKENFGDVGSLVTINNYVDHTFSYTGLDCIDQSTTAYLLNPDKKVAEKTCDKAAYRLGNDFTKPQRLPHPTDNVIGW